MDALNLLPTHPRWGQAIGLRRSGEPIWPFRGASEPDGDTSGQSADGGDGTAGQSAGTASGSTTDPASTSDGQSADTDEDTKVSRADYDALRNRLSAADKGRADLEAKLKAIEDKDKSELDKATERAKVLEDENGVLKEQNQTLKLERAMLTDAEWGADKWQDPEEVLEKLNRAVRDEQVIIKDGEPDKDSMKRFLKDLASKKQYLLKPTGGTNTGGKSGTNVGGGDKRGSSGEMTDEQVRSKYRIR